MRRMILGIALLVIAVGGLYLVLHADGEVYAFGAGLLVVGYIVGAALSLIGYVEAGEERRRYYEDGGRRNMEAHGEYMLERARRQQEQEP